jgi:hypothetical protein
MAQKITDRATIIAEGVIRQNGVGYTVYADTQVGQRVKQSYANRYWLILKPKTGRTIRQSTQKPALIQEWLALIAENGVAA